jgi:hypothetical protein
MTVNDRTLSIVAERFIECTRKGANANKVRAFRPP